MAKLSPETKIILHNLIEQLLEIIDEAKKTEFLLLEEFRETNQTTIVLDELKPNKPTIHILKFLFLELG